MGARRIASGYRVRANAKIIDHVSISCLTDNLTDNCELRTVSLRGTASLYFPYIRCHVQCSCPSVGSIANRK